jgi:hypothetical protein
MNRFALWLPLCLLAGLSGCADIIDGSTQVVSVQTTGAAGEIDGVQCALNNKKGTWQVTSPGSVTVHRGSEPLGVSCTKNGYAPATEQVASSTNNYVFGNVLLGGGVGATVDTVSGAAWKYPKLITVTMQPAPAKTANVN